ncbi:N-acetylglucosamine kinase [Thermoflavimicrobium daqui]|jgi:N-acetylglucosamine kinase-like BadF-type ATPase|uniref:N-acetylglucosamine kinase n=1 Tax=Thermoflavimicrobium daqui TaxID=2137476 RepID=A0A364K3T4_9BACL|nr:BadF/BadG/BcrA/BcrD ATPase family protein [Thermoflavimicrobium daqui]RAL24016.1 N-acetylglucosamine kinase [Thermoflavimicrobium daqui]
MNRLHLPLLAVDGGGTKSLAVLLDQQQQALGEGQAGGCNYQGIGKEAATQSLTACLDKAMKDLAKKKKLSHSEIQLEVECAVFGMAGLDTEQDRQVILEMIDEALKSVKIYPKNLLIENDGFATLLGETEGKPGILVIAGTGSIVYGVNEAGMYARTGGWGHRVGDEGSGYWIGKQAVIAILRAEDGRGPNTSLSESIYSQIGAENGEDLVNWVYSPSYSVKKMAELSQFVYKSYLDGDEVAKTILLKASEELFIAARAVIEQLELKEKAFQIILQGGVLKHQDFVRQTLMDQLYQYVPEAKIDMGKQDPIFGIITKGLSFLQRECE